MSKRQKEKTGAKAFISRRWKKSYSSWFFTFLRTSLIVGLFLMAGVTYWFQHPVKNEQLIVLIPKGSSLSQITILLQKEKVLNSTFLFKMILLSTGWAKRLQAGEYLIPPSVTPAKLMAILKSGDVILHPLTLIEGETSFHFVQKLNSDERFQGDCKIPSEGSLLPETYHFARGTERQTIINHLQKAMQHALANLPLHSFSKLELVTLASIVEKETSLPQERPLVAAVFLNRLKEGMPLQADPTIIYALTKGESDLGRNLSHEDLRTQSPYNTYTQTGLPPSPIANPSLASLTAVVRPAPVHYLYFVADGSGGHVFATTLKDHQKNHAAWRKKREAIRLETGN